jgi:hypothetical protein
MSITDNVTAVFSSPEIGWVHFQFANRLIAPAAYRSMLDLLKNKRLKCAVKSEIGNRAEYDPSADTIFAGDDGFGGIYHDDKSVLIHEGLHAILDSMAGKDSAGKAAPMKGLADETMGYLAGAIYLVAVKDSSIRDTPDNQPALEAVKAVRAKIDALNAAAGIAKTPPFTFDGIPGANPPLSFGPPDVRALQAAIKQHRFYATTWNDTSQQDGIK